MAIFPALLALTLYKATQGEFGQKAGIAIVMDSFLQAAVQGPDRPLVVKADQLDVKSKDKRQRLSEYFARFKGFLRGRKILHCRSGQAWNIEP